jgi:hypothetical protein
MAHAIGQSRYSNKLEWRSSLKNAGVSSLARSQSKLDNGELKELIWRRKNINEYASEKGPKKLQREFREEYDLNKPGINLPPAFSQEYHEHQPLRTSAAGGSHPQLAVGGEKSWGNPQGASHDYSYQTGGMSEELKRQFLLHGGRKRKHATKRNISNDILGTANTYGSQDRWTTVTKLVHTSPSVSAASSPAPRMYNPSMSQSSTSTGFRL